MDPRSILLHLGLSEKESTVYLAALELGMAPVSIIARKAKLKRPTTYLILKDLAKKGMAECFLKNGIRYYSVQSPVALYQRFQSHMEEFKRALPEMMAVENQLTLKPKITFYEGKEEVRRLYLDVLNSKGEILNYFLPDEAYKFFGQEWVDTEHIAERVKRGIRIRAIMPDSPWTRRYVARSDKELREVRIISDPKLTFKNETYIYDHKISIFSFEGDFALLIESPDVAEAQRTLFELAWGNTLLK